MPTAIAVRQRFLAEWYMPSTPTRTIADIAGCLRLSSAAIATEPHRPKLLYAVEVPEDSYAFGVFAAHSADVVAQACRQAGLPADRVSAAVEALLAPDPETPD
jgi:hypothetical protein